MTEQDLAGRKALVTGGASGIGLACVREFASRGAHVTIADLDASPSVRKPHIAEAISFRLSSAMSGL